MQNQNNNEINVENLSKGIYIIEIQLENEKVFLMRKIDEVQGEIFQLENNIQFFTNTKNAKKENSIVLEVRKNIEKHKEELTVLKDKLKQLRNLKAE